MTPCIAAAGAAPPKASGEKLCVLTQSDFRPFGTIVWSKPVVNVDDDGASTYCVYRGKSVLRAALNSTCSFRQATVLRPLRGRDVQYHELD
jgi:hypothetical protein